MNKVWIMENAKKSQRGLKICCGVTIIFFILILVVLIVLFITILKPKEPKIINNHVTLEKIDFQVFPVIKGNVSLGISMTVSNPNYGSFAYHGTTSHVKYRGHIVAEAEIKDDKIPAHGSLNISTSVNIYADKLASDEHFLEDYFHGVLNFTASTTLHGKVGLFNFLKMKATSYCTCEISVFVQDVRVDSHCKTRVML